VALAIVLLGMPDVAWAAPDGAALAPSGMAEAIPDTELVVVMRDAIVLPVTGLPALPEPAVLLMMLLGVCVIGYRARTRSEPFR
jgi:hypothetical protein